MKRFLAVAFSDWLARHDMRRAAEIRADLAQHTKRQTRRARYREQRARARRLFAAWLSPRAAELPLAPAAPIQFPRGLNTQRTGQILSGIQFEKGGAA